MRLPDNILELICGCGTMRLGQQQSDKRQAARVPLSRKATLFRLSGGVPGATLTGRMREVSATGAGLLMAEPMKVGDEFVLLIPKPQDGTVPILCKVARCDRGGAGVYVIGAIFKQLYQTPPGAAAHR